MRALRISVLALVIPLAAVACERQDDATTQMGIEDAGDADNDGIDSCIFWATEPDEYEACYDAGSDPSLGPGPGRADDMNFDPVPGNE
jgi:hypothetical protein